MDGERWLLDTGAPTSFGKRRGFALAGEAFELEDRFLGLDAAELSRLVGVECVGLLGAEVLGRFHHLVDVSGGTLTVSRVGLSHAGQAVPMEEFMGIPIVTVRVGGRALRMFFDTGAQFSYVQDDSLRDFPFVGTATDFYPGFGEFRVELHQVDLALGGQAFTLQCGRLPALLGTSLGLAGASGILGNEILRDRVVGYFPRRHTLVL